MKFKEENKEKHNKEEIIDVKFEYQLKHNQLSKFRNGESSLITNVIILEPVGDSTYPFKDLKQNKCVGFLTDDAMIPKSKEIIMHPRNEQFDRIRHFLKNISNEEIYDEDEIQFNNLLFKREPDNKVEFKIIIKELELDKIQLNKLKFFHVFMFN